MSEENKEQAKEHAARAAKQLKHAAKNVVEAADSEKDVVVDHAEQVVESGKTVVKRIVPEVLASSAFRMSGGFIFLGLSVYAGAISVNKFREALEMSKGAFKNGGSSS